jgi:hypothetical protein
MFRILHHLSDHCLYDTNVSIECTSKQAPSECDPEVWSAANEEQR